MSDPNRDAQDETVLDDWFERWRIAYVTRGEDIPPESLCGDRTDLVRTLRGLVQFEKLNLGGPVPKVLTAESRYEIMGPYEPDQRGGQGELFLANDPAFPRVVLVKRIRTERAADPDAIRKFRRELLLNGQLEHPNIVPVFDYGTDKGELFFVMRLVPGEAYHLRIQRFHRDAARNRYRSLEFLTLLQNFIVVCRAVGYAHSRMALHLDISTANIRIGDHGEVYLLDWGAGRRDRRSPEPPHPDHADSVATPVRTVSLNNERELTSSVNPCFMSPEQALGHPLTRATDIYQLGAVLYVLLTGEYPFEPARVGSAEFQSLTQRVVRGEVRPIPSHLRIPGPLLTICRKALSVEPENRCGTADEMAEQLECWLSDAEVSAHTYSLGERFDLSRRKYPGRWTAVAATLLTGIVASVIATALVLNKNNDLEQSNTALELSRLEALEAKNKSADYANKYLGLAVQLGDDDLLAMDRLRLLNELLTEAKLEHDNSNPTSLRLLAAIQLGRCKILRRLSHFQEAEAAASEARKLLQALPAEAFGEGDRANLIRVLHDLGDNYLDRGQANAAKECYDTALRHVTDFDDLMDSRADLLLLRCISNRKLARYYADLGNAWIALDFRRAALQDSSAAIALDSSDQVRIEHANSLRLVSASEAQLKYENLEGTEELQLDSVTHAKESLMNADQAIIILDSAAESTSILSRHWLESRYYTLNQLASALELNNEFQAAKPVRADARVLLERLRITDPARVEWALNEMQARMNELLFQRNEDVPDVNAIDRTMAKIQDDLNALLATFPENIRLISRPGDYMCAVAELEVARRLNGEERESHFHNAADLLAANKGCLRRVLETFPESEVFTQRLSMVLQNQGVIAFLHEDHAQYSKLSSAGHQLMRKFYLARLDEEPSESSWKVLSADQLYGEAMFWGTREDWAKSEKLFGDAIQEYEAVIACEPDNHFWISHLANALTKRAGAGFAIEWSSTGEVSSGARESQCRIEERVLELRRKCCELTSGLTRAGYCGQLDKTYSGILPMIRREALLGERGPYLTHFGTLEAFRRRWRDDRDRYLADDERASSPFQPRSEQTFQSGIGATLYADRLLASTLEQLQSTGDLLCLGPFDYDDDVVKACVDRIRLFREWTFSAEQTEQIPREITWMLRAVNASLLRMGQRGEQSAWLSRIQRDVAVEFESLSPPQLPWAGLVQNPDDWAQMNYVRLAQSARANEKLGAWFEFMNGEFTEAAALSKSPQASSTYAESFVFRQLLDDLILDVELRTDVLALAKQYLDEGKDIQATFRSVLGVLAWLSEDAELAQRLEPAISDDAVSLIKWRLALNGNRLRRFADIVDCLKTWYSTADTDKSRLRLGYNLALCQHELGNTDEALATIDDLSRKVPAASGLKGMRLRFLVDQFRGDPELLAKLGEIEPTSPDDDLNMAIVAAYVEVFKAKTQDSVRRLEGLIERPDGEDLIWAFEVLGDAHRLCNNVAEARRAYDRSLAEMPPTTAAKDRAFVRVKEKLAKLP